MASKRPKKQLESSNILELGYRAGVSQKIMRAHCAVIWLDHFRFASYGPVSGDKRALHGDECHVPL